MDEGRFDELLKGKVEGYEAPIFDPAALSGLHYKMASAYEIPWYTKNRTELFMAGSVVFITLMIFFSQWYFKESKDWQTQLTELKIQQAQLGDLQDEIRLLKGATPDTIWTIQESSYQPSRALMDELSSLKAELKRKENINSDGLIYIGSRKDLPNDIIKDLERLGILFDDNNQIYITRDYQRAPIAKRKELAFEWDNKPHRLFPLSTEEEVSKNKGSRKLTAEESRKLERHYWKGIGLEIGPTLQYNQPLAAPIQSVPVLGIGIAADVILSPSLSLESGIVYSVFHYTARGESNNSINHPSLQTDLGDLRKTEVDAKVVELPMNLKYRTPLNRKFVVLSLGASGYLHLKEEFEYTHQNDLVTGNIVNVQKLAEPTFYFGSVNGNIGIQHLLRNGQKLETNFFYKKNIGPIGAAGVTPDFLGTRVIYWINIR